MPATTSIRIIFARAGQEDTPVFHPRAFWLSQTIRLDELQSADSPDSWSISRSTGELPVLLSAVESARLAVLLTGLPAHGLSAEVRSFDGVEYELVVLQTGGPLVFRWQNEDWRYYPNSPREEWERVTALAEFARSLAGGEG